MLTLKGSCVLRVMFAIVVAATISELGCNGFFSNGVPPAPPPGGFSLAVNVDNGTGQPALDPSATVQGYKSANICSSSGNPLGATCPAIGNQLQTNGYIGNNQFISGAVVAAGWSGNFRSNTINPSGGKCDPLNGTPWGPTPIWYKGRSYTVATCFTGVANGQFFASGSLPTSVTVQASGFSSSTGMPQFHLYSLKNGQITQLTATSISGTGAATFGFPKNSNGSSLGTGIYSYVVSNKISAGISPFASGLISIGGIDTSHQTPMGIDANTFSTNAQTCHNSQNGWTCDSPTYSTQIVPVYTLETPGTVCASMGCVTVGSQPVAVKAYTTESQTQVTGSQQTGGQTTVTLTGPGRAIVANYGGNSASIVDLMQKTLVGTVNVGLQPTALVVNGTSKAYLANYGSASISEVDLGALTQTRVANVGSSPAALVMDPSGTALWVGGLNYISKVDLSSFTVTSTITVSGQVASLAISSGQNQFVYSTVTNSGTNANFTVSHAQFATGSNAKADYQYSMSTGSPLAQFYSLNTTSSSSPPGWVNAGGVLVSASYGNRYVIDGTPTGFLLMDLQSGIQMLQGSTASPVRGIATDPGQGTVFLTAPDSNSLITLPLPPVQTN